jgi:type IV fimbrial biogenesis protein FimT
MYTGKRGDRHRGFTLVELTIAMAILAIILGIAVPSYQVFAANNKVSAAESSVIRGLELARSTAMAIGENVIVCGSADAQSCSDWDSGWLVYRNADNRIVRASSFVDDEGLSELAVDGESIVFGPDGSSSLVAPDDSGPAEGPATITIRYRNPAVTRQCSKIEVDPLGSISSCESATGEDARCC